MHFATTKQFYNKKTSKKDRKKPILFKKFAEKRHFFMKKEFCFGESERAFDKGQIHQFG